MLYVMIDGESASSDAVYDYGEFTSNSSATWELVNAGSESLSIDAITVDG